jgi:hypothetical protein
MHSPSKPMPHNFLSFEVIFRRTRLGSAPLNEWSAPRKDFYLHITTRNAQNKEIHGIRNRNLRHKIIVIAIFNKT